MTSINRGGTVLIVEDFKDTADIICRLLQKKNFRPVPAYSLTEARNKLLENHLDVAVLDINLPDGSGLDFLHEIKQHDSELPVIMLTAYTELDNAIKSLREGADDFITKPFENDYLLHSITRALEKKKLTDRLRQSEKFRIMGELAAGVAHDFNNLLSSISAHLYLLKRALKDQNCSDMDHIKTMEMAIEDGAAIVARLNSMGRKGTNDRQVIDFNNLIEDTVLMTKPKWDHEQRRKGRHISLKTELSPLKTAFINPSDLREVLTNLIFNAVDAMPDGGEITIRSEDIGDSLQCSVSDTGIGLAPEIKDRIFDPFFTTKGQGTGIGLSVSYAIVENHGGTLTVDSVPGEGTTFTIILPFNTHDALKNLQ